MVVDGFKIVIGGLATDYCVKNTVLDALKKGFKVKAIENAMRAVDLQPGDGERAVDEMRAAGADIVTAREAGDSIKPGAQAPGSF